MRLIRGILGAVLVGALGWTSAAATAPPVSAVRVDWRQDGYGAGQTSYNPGESAIGERSIGGLTHRWMAVGVGPERSCSEVQPPVVASGRLYLTDRAGISAHATDTGRRLWHFQFPDPEDETPAKLAVTGGLVLAANSSCVSQSDPNGRLMALDQVTGAQRWQLRQDPPVHALVVDRGVAVVSGSSLSDTETVTAYRISDGALLWRQENVLLGGAVSAAGRLLLTRTGGAGSRAVSIRTGATLWSQPVAWQALAADPTGRRFYARTPSGTFVAVNAGTGAVAWFAAPASEKIAVDRDRVYVADDNTVEAHSAQSGEVVWRAHEGVEVGQPVCAGGLVYTPLNNGALRIRTAGTGNLVLPGVPVNTSGHVVVSGGRLFAINGQVLNAYAP